MGPMISYLKTAKTFHFIADSAMHLATGSELCGGRWLHGDNAYDCGDVENRNDMLS